MLKKIFYVSVLFVFIAPAIIIPHGDEKNKDKEKVEKVTSVQHEDEADSDSLHEAEENEAVEKDFSTIRKEVEESTIPTVIKAISLAAFIAGLAFLYLPRKKKDKSNG